MLSGIRAKLLPLKPSIDITLDSDRKTHSNSDRLDGSVSITATIDTIFDDISIEFTGSTRTYVDRMTTATGMPSLAQGYHQFLRLAQPDVEQQYPRGRILQAGHPYRFRFSFVVPASLLPSTCEHEVVGHVVRDAHLKLPPTFGDGILEARDVLANPGPKVAKIAYGISATVTHSKARENVVVQSALASKTIQLQIRPSLSEQPPLDTSAGNEDYVMRTERIVKKGILKGSIGTLTMEAAQPRALHLRTDSAGPPLVQESRSDCSTEVTVQLRFDPKDEDMPPPQLGDLKTRLRACTFVATFCRRTFPSEKGVAAHDISQDLVTKQISLQSRSLTDLNWAKYDQPEALPSINPSSVYRGKSYYVARLTYAIELPSHKMLVPTFHSCLASRIYQLKLDLSLRHSGLGRNLELQIPLQIITGSSGQAVSVQDSSSGDLVEGDVSSPLELDNQHSSASNDGHVHPADDLPPQYSVLVASGPHTRPRIQSPAPRASGSSSPPFTVQKCSVEEMIAKFQGLVYQECPKSVTFGPQGPTIAFGVR